MTIFFLFRGLLIGLLFGIPAGAVGAMTVQRTWRYGVRAGFLTGLGSSAADCFYACVGAFGITLVSDFLLERQNMIHLAGGCFILLMGVNLLLREEKYKADIADTSDLLRMFLLSFAIGITNPAAIFTFLLAFSWLGIAGKMKWGEGILLVTGVFIGTFIWWGILSIGTQKLKKQAKPVNPMKLNRVFGVLLLLLGSGILIQFIIA